MDVGELGHFSLLEKIGEGGMGRVYKARDMRLDRLVAIKVLPESRRADADRRARFVQEAKAASALNHPNIITIHEIGEQDGRTFIVMELVDGKPLNELIPDKGMRLPAGLRSSSRCLRHRDERLRRSRSGSRFLLPAAPAVRAKAASFASRLHRSAHSSSGGEARRTAREGLGDG